MLIVKNLNYIVDNKVLINNVSFTVKEGMILSIIGPNGSGKSTLIRLIAGLIKPISGEITLFNKDIYDCKRKDLAKVISYVPQSSIGFKLKVEEFVKSGRYPYLGFFGVMNQSDIDVVNHMMSVTGIYHLKDRYIDMLSGGERQRVYIAAALAQEARLLLLDEPTVFLDPRANADINELLIKLNKEESITIIMVTHDINYALLSGATFLGLNEGEVIFYGDGSGLGSKKAFDKLFSKEFNYINHPLVNSIQILP